MPEVSAERMGFELDKHFLSVDGVLVVSHGQLALTFSCMLAMDSDRALGDAVSRISVLQ